MFKKLISASNLLVGSVVIFQLIGCGTIFYPERKGQQAGKIDAGVAVLDGIGLLFFLIPGVIAFAVDFNNGTIYLPGTSRSSLELKDMEQVKFDAQHSTWTSIEGIIQKETGHAVTLGKEDMQVTQLHSTDEMLAQFANILPGVRISIALR